jgi:hypothetical protein
MHFNLLTGTPASFVSWCLNQLRPPNLLEVALPGVQQTSADKFLAQLVLIDSPNAPAFQVLLTQIKEEKFREAVLSLATIPNLNLFKDPWCREALLLALTPFASESLVALYAMQTLEDLDFQDSKIDGASEVIAWAKGLLIAKVRCIRASWNDFSLVPEGQDLIDRLSLLSLGFNRRDNGLRDLEALGSEAAREVIRALPNSPQLSALIQRLALGCHKLGDSNPWLVDLVSDASPESVDCLISMLNEPVRADPDSSYKLIWAMVGLEPSELKSKQLGLKLALGVAPWILGAGSYVWVAIAREVLSISDRLISRDSEPEVDRTRERMLALVALNALREKVEAAVNQGSQSSYAQALVAKIDQVLLAVSQDPDVNNGIGWVARMSLARRLLT